MKKLVIGLALLCTAVPAAAQTKIVETATFVPSSGGWEIGTADDVQYATRFHLDNTTFVSAVGMANLVDPSGGTYYAAIVPVSGPTAFPAGLPFNDSEAVAHTTFAPAGGDQRIPLAVTLSSGDYMLIFGAGKYGTTGASGTIGVNGQTVLGSPQVYFHCCEAYWGAQWHLTADDNSGQPAPLRFWVEAEDNTQAIFDTVETRASQTSVDALTTTVGTLATQQSLTNLGSSIGNAFTALTGVVNGDAAQTNGNISAFSTSVNGQFSNLFSSVSALGGGTTLGQLATTLSAKANDSSVTALSGQVTALSSSLTGLATTSDVNAAATTVSGAVSSRASQSSVDALAASLGGNNDASVRLQIEQDLATGQRLITFLTPASAGGKLDTVRDVVQTALTEAQAAGVNTTKAQSWFTKADAAAADGSYATAYDDYASAYQALIK